MTDVSRKSVLKYLAAAAGACVAAPAAAQIPSLPSIDRLRRRGREIVRDAAMDQLAQTLFPLERTNTLIRARADPPSRFRDGPFRDMRELARTPTGGFVLRQGAWELDGESFCLNFGKYEKPGGAGFLSGEWSGRVAQGVELILGRLNRFPEVSTRDAQYLIWAHLAGVRPGQMRGGARSAADTLFTPEEFSRFDGGAFSFVPPELTDQVRRRLPADVQRLLSVRDGLLQRARRGASFDEIEALAVLRGDPAPDAGDEEVPDGQWNAHPDGFLIRYFSEIYSRTRVQIVALDDLPETEPQTDSILITRDQTYGRIVGIAVRGGGPSVRISYAAGALRHRDYPELQGFLVTALDYDSGAATAAQPSRTDRLSTPFVVWQWRPGAEPARRSRRAGVDPAWRRGAKPVLHSRRAGPGPVLRAGLRQDGILDGLSDDVQGELLDQALQLAPRNVQRANEAYERYGAYRDAAGEFRRGTEADVQSLGNLSNFREGMREAFTGTTGSRLGFIGRFHARLARALDYATQVLSTLPTGSDDSPVTATLPNGDIEIIPFPPERYGGGLPTYEPSRELALPGSLGSQSRGISGR